MRNVLAYSRCFSWIGPKRRLGLVPRFANPHTGWLVLSMASTLAGNLTITGSVANIIVVERARKEANITFGEYFRVGLPVTVLTMVFGYLWLSWVK